MSHRRCPRWAVRWVAPALAVSLALTLGLGAAWAQPVVPATAPPIVPAEVRIPAIGLIAPVAPVGTVVAAAPFLGGKSVSTFGVPQDASSIGWWSDGPMAGGPGMAILLGHTKVGGAAVFNRLGELRPGDLVSVRDGAGTAVDFRITRVVAGVPKTDPDALQRVLAQNEATSQLALITCGGYFDQTVRASEDNIIAFAASA